MEQTEVVKETDDLERMLRYRFQGLKLRPQISEILGSHEMQTKDNEPLPGNKVFACCLTRGKTGPELGCGGEISFVESHPNFTTVFFNFIF